MTTPANSVNEPTTGVVGMTGTGFTATALTQYLVCLGHANSYAIDQVSGTGTSGQVLTSNGAGAEPTWQAAPGGDLVFISTGTASSSASLDFTGLTSDYWMYIFVGNNIIPATGSTDLYFRTSTDGGSTFAAGITDYNWTFDSGSTTSTDDNINLTRNISNVENGTNETLDFFLYIINPTNAVGFKRVTCFTEWSTTTDGNRLEGSHISGMRRSTDDVDAVRFLMSSGNITSGSIKMYGLSAT